MSKVVSKDEFYQLMTYIREMRQWAVNHNASPCFNGVARATPEEKWAVNHNASPWSVRQVLVTALEIDTAVALRRGVSKAELDAFDEGAKLEARRWLEKEGSHG